MDDNEIMQMIDAEAARRHTADRRHLDSLLGEMNDGLPQWSARRRLASRVAAMVVLLVLPASYAALLPPPPQTTHRRNGLCQPNTHPVMKRLWIVTAVLLVLLLGGITAWRLLPRGGHDVSDLYSECATQQGVRAGFIENYRFDDSTLVDVTTVEALDSAPLRPAGARLEPCRQACLWRRCPFYCSLCQ